MDLHQCGDCEKQFESFEDFLIHKLLFEKYKLMLEPSKRVVGLQIPKFVKTQSQAVSNASQTSLLLGINKDETCMGEVIETGLERTHQPTVNSINKPVLQAETSSNSLPKNSCEENLREITVEVELSKAVSEVGSHAFTPVGVGNEDVDLEIDDNVSVTSQTEGLRIDESETAKDNQSSPLPDALQEPDSKSDELMCSFCNRCYKNKVVLRVHQETVHRGSRQFPCPKCKHNFKTKGSLVRHMRIHTGERPFCCSECGRCFHDSGSLCRHINRLHRRISGRMRSTEIKIIVTRLAPEED